MHDAPAGESAPFTVDDCDVPDLRNAIREIALSGYSEAAVRDRLGLTDIAELRWKALPIYRDERLGELDSLALAIEIFLLQGAVPDSELERLLSAPSREVLLRNGILSMDPAGLVRARASLFPVGNCLIFSDHAWHKLPHPGYTTVPSDQVMFVGNDSRFLARATVRRPARACLDLCTGSGIHAILAAAHSERVLAVDINPRAVRCARFNARISGASGVHVVAGDLFGPVAEHERFDLITANPPFVPSPVDEFTFRDGGRSGETVLRRIVAGLPVYLAPGGIAQVITELGERDGEPVAARVRSWLGDAPMDLHVLRLHVYSAADYAIGHANSDAGYGAYLESVGEWARNLKAHGYSRIVLALLAFRWSDPVLGAPWDRDEESQPPRREAGAEIDAVFARERGVRTRNRGAVDRLWVRRAGPVALTDSQVLGAQIRAVSRATLLGQALSTEHRLDPVESEILRRLDSPVSASELLQSAQGSAIGENSIRAAIDSLQRHGLVNVMELGNPGLPAG